MLGILFDEKTLKILNINCNKKINSKIYIFSEEIIKKLKTKKLGKERIDFFKENFEKKIFELDFYFNEKNNTCYFENKLNIYNYFEIILNTIFEYINKDCIIFYKTKFKSINYKILEFFGFNDPFFYKNLIYFSKLNDGIFTISDNLKIKTENIFNIEKTKNCYSYYKFSKKCINFLKKCVKSGFHLEKEKLTFQDNKKQSEITGEFYIKKIKKENNRIINTLEINKKSLNTGEEENVKVLNTRYNFHSHPEDAYKNHSVKKAWPSSTDYLGFLQLGINTIFHLVTTLEGVYIISFGENWFYKLNEIDKDFIRKYYDINKKENITPKEYTKKVNSILYKGFPIFKVAFINWNDIKRKMIKINFARYGKSCILSEKNKKYIRKII